MGLPEVCRGIRRGLLGRRPRFPFRGASLGGNTSFSSFFFLVFLWTATPFGHSCGSRAAVSQSSVFRSNQEMRAGLGPAQQLDASPYQQGTSSCTCVASPAPGEERTLLVEPVVAYSHQKSHDGFPEDPAGLVLQRVAVVLGHLSG